MQIGIMAGNFNRPTLSERFSVIASHGISCVQFSFACVGLSELPDHIESKLCDEIKDEMAKHGITMSALSGTFNMIDPDVSKRQDSLRKLENLASVCDCLGTSVISLCTGTKDPYSMWHRHPDNDSEEAWNDLISSTQKALEIAEKYKVMLAFEPEVSNVIDSAIKGRRLIDNFKSPYLKVVMDGANIFHKGELPRMREILSEAFDLLGDYIVLAHAKDLDHDGDAGNLPAGKGLLDYDHYLSLFKQHNIDVPIILHGLGEEDIDNCVSFLHKKMS